MNIQSAVDVLNSFVPDPTQGLPEEVFRFASTIVPMVNVDLLIKSDRGQTLLAWREDEFFPPGWHIPGGIIRYKETAHDRIRTVAANELGAVVRSSETPIAFNEIIMEPSWRIRGHFISLLYRCVLLERPTTPEAINMASPGAGEWAWHSGCPENLYKSQEFYRKFILHDRM